VVARLYDPGQGEIFNRLGIQTVAPIDWSSDRIAGLLLSSQIETTCNFGAGTSTW